MTSETGARGFDRASGISIGEPVEIVPGENLPAQCEVLRSNNNLDIATHDGRLWLAWRSAPSHFAGTETVLNVVSSDDWGASWRFEHAVCPGRDLREPRLLSWKDNLYLYWFEAGTSPVKFEPGGIHAARRDASGWTNLGAISAPGYVGWRAREIDGRALMSVYSGGEAIYNLRPAPTKVEIWESSDGIDWEPLDKAHPVVHIGGTETDFALGPGGGLIAVTRKEGPFGGWGTDICTSSPENWSNWRPRRDPRKLDSPLMFTHAGRYFVIARRQRAFGGRYDLGFPGVPIVLRTRMYQLAYWVTPKRTALWEVDPETYSLEWIMDFPSRGDTAFAGIVQREPGEWLVYNYSSPLDERDRVWLDGQLGQTKIYATTLTIA